MIPDTVSTSLVQSAVRRDAKSRFAVIPAGIISKYQLRFPLLTGMDNYRSIKSHHRLTSHTSLKQ